MAWIEMRGYGIVTPRSASGAKRVSVLGGGQRTCSQAGQGGGERQDDAL